MSAFIGAMNIVLRDLQDYCRAYVDDIIIFSKTLEEHFRHIETVLTHIREAKMTIAEEKCNWAKQSVRFLGFIISDQGIEPNPDKVSSIRGFLEPRCRRDVSSFLGMINYFRTFIPRCAEISKPLTELTELNTKFPWTDEAQEAFDKLKDSLVNVIM